MFASTLTRLLCCGRGDRVFALMVWMLRGEVDASGQPLILTDTAGEYVVNLSFERLLGKLIAHQDMLAQVMAGSTRRAMNTVAHGLVRITFVPL